MVKWPTDSGLWPGDPRRRLGHALWDAFNNVNNDPAIGGALGRDEAFRQWIVENLRILNWLPPFPDAMDFFAGAVARIGPKVPHPLYSSPVSMHVYQALYANGLSGGCY